MIPIHKLPKIEKFNGNTVQYKGWKMQVETYLFSLNPNWVPFMEQIAASPNTISLRFPRATQPILGIQGPDLKIIAGNLW